MDPISTAMGIGRAVNPGVQGAGWLGDIVRGQESNREYERQKEFAQMGIQWRVADAKADARRHRVERDGLGEADDLEVAGVHSEERRGLVGHRAVVVLQVGAVGGADLDEARAALA